MIRIKDYINIIIKYNFIWIGYKKGIIIPRNKENIFMLNKLSKEQLNIEDFKFFNNDIKKVIKYLYNNGYIVNKKELKIRSLYKESYKEKTAIYLEKFFDKTSDLMDEISKYRICIIGVGGIGGNVLLSLAQMGFENFCIIDDDKVQASNLNRQCLLKFGDLNELKIKSIYKNILEIFPKISIIIKNKKIIGRKDLIQIIDEYKPSIIVQAADYPSEINNYIVPCSLENEIPCIIGGVGYDKGFYKLYKLGDTFKSKDSINLNYVKGSLSVTNNIVSSYMSLEIFKYLINIKYDSAEKEVILDFWN